MGTSTAPEPGVLFETLELGIIALLDRWEHQRDVKRSGPTLCQLIKAFEPFSADEVKRAINQLADDAVVEPYVVLYDMSPQIYVRLASPPMAYGESYVTRARASVEVRERKIPYGGTPLSRE